MANDPWVPKPTDVPFLLVNEFDLLDSTADEDVFQIDITKNCVVLERQGLVSGWTRRDVGSKSLDSVAIQAYSATAPLYDEIGDLVDWTMPFKGGTAIGDRAFFGYGPGTGYQLPFKVNDWFMVQFTCTGDGPVAHGYLATDGKTTETAATTGGTQLTLPAVTATEKVIANCHMTAFTGVDATIKLQSDNVWPMTTPADQITFSQFTGVGSAHGETAVGAITDTEWRFDLATTGGITSITFVVVLGIVTA